MVRRSERIGSSPRLRGTAHRTLEGDLDRRFIPAPAGNSGSKGGKNIMNSVHPRACGEQHFPEGSTTQSAGSSPRLRGTVSSITTPSTSGRFIPAPAGNRKLPKSKSNGWTVHPRACGEQAFQSLLCVSTGGSSPRLRGTDICSNAEMMGDRFIPAPAGNRVRVAVRDWVVPVHPRACGEQFIIKDVY